MPVSAQTSLGARVGTAGAGLELGTGLSRQFDGRLLVSGFDYDDDFETSNVRYDGEAELRFFAAIVDWHPGASSFRLSAGLVVNDSTITGTALLRDIIEDQAPEVLDLPLPRSTSTISAESAPTQRATTSPPTQASVGGESQGRVAGAFRSISAPCCSAHPTSSSHSKPRFRLARFQMLRH